MISVVCVSTFCFVMCVSVRVRHVPACAPFCMIRTKATTGKFFSPNWPRFLVTRRYSDYYVILPPLKTIPGSGAEWRGHIHSVPSRSDGDSGSVGWSCQGKSKSGLLRLIAVNIIETFLTRSRLFGPEVTLVKKSAQFSWVLMCANRDSSMATDSRQA